MVLRQLGSYLGHSGRSANPFGKDSTTGADFTLLTAMKST
jgi:hypothetical protein